MWAPHLGLAWSPVVAHIDQSQNSFSMNGIVLLWIVIAPRSYVLNDFERKYGLT